MYKENENEEIANLILSLKEIRGIGNKTIIDFLKYKKKEIESSKDFSLEFFKRVNYSPIIKRLNCTENEWDKIRYQSRKTLEMSKKEGIYYLHPYMKQYPRRLLENKIYPPLLFYKGNVNLLNYKKIVAVIGTRKPTKLGAKLGTKFSENFSKRGYAILSGLAIGSDTVGHIGALNASGGTIALLPTPLNRIYPKQNQELAKKIVEKNGTLVSEYALGSNLKGRNLVNNLIARDEWQAGMSDGVLATETSLKGGSNHAIRHALKEKKPIGMFDYRNTKLENKFLTDKRFEGNLMYINSGKAKPIFQLESLNEFDKDLSESSEKFKNVISNKPSEKNKQYSQISLFGSEKNGN